MKRRHVAKSVIFSALLLSACGTENSLDGSIGEILSLEFVRLELKKAETSLVVDYINRVDGSVEEITLRLTVTTVGLDMNPSSELRDDAFLEHVFLQRATRDNEHFPSAEGGSISFGAFDFMDGGHVDGQFAVLFTDGRSMNGSFNGAIDEQQ